MKTSIIATFLYLPVLYGSSDKIDDMKYSSGGVNNHHVTLPYNHNGFLLPPDLTNEHGQDRIVFEFLSKSNYTKHDIEKFLTDLLYRNQQENKQYIDIICFDQSGRRVGFGSSSTWAVVFPTYADVALTPFVVSFPEEQDTSPETKHVMIGMPSLVYHACKFLAVPYTQNSKILDAKIQRMLEVSVSQPEKQIECFLDFIQEAQRLLQENRNGSNSLHGCVPLDAKGIYNPGQKVAYLIIFCTNENVSFTPFMIACHSSVLYRVVAGYNVSHDMRKK